MPEIAVRKYAVTVEEIFHEGGPSAATPLKRAAIVTVIRNPFAGRYQEDLAELIDVGEELGGLLAERAVKALGIEGAKIESYGKAAAVGANGELEHAAAILHPKLGAPFRKVLGKGAALIPSSKKRGGPGCALDIPLGGSGEDYFWADELFVSTADSDAAQGQLTGRHHLAFQAASRAAVEAFHAAALAGGGTDNGAPGERSYHPGYYAAFALDPDGNNIEAVYHGEAQRSAASVTVTF